MILWYNRSDVVSVGVDVFGLPARRGVWSVCPVSGWVIEEGHYEARDRGDQPG